MNVKHIQVGQVFKNYKVLCEYLNEPIKSGKSKQLQLKDWERYFSYKKQGNSFIISNIYPKPLEKVDNRKNNVFSIQAKQEKYCEKYDNFKVPIENCKDMIVYKIVLGNEIYIGSTINPNRRFREHNKNIQSNHNKTHNMLQHGATFELIEVFDNEKSMREYEAQLIKQYSHDNDWVCVNKMLNSNTKDRETKTYSNKKSTFIKINNSDYDMVLELLKQNNIVV